MRNTFDVSAIALLKQISHLPVIADPSHAAGHSDLVPALARIAVAACADGLIVEVHPNPAKAWSDGSQSLDFAEFDEMMADIEPWLALRDREHSRRRPGVARRETAPGTVHGGGAMSSAFRVLAIVASAALLIPLCGFAPNAAKSYEAEIGADHHRDCRARLRAACGATRSRAISQGRATADRA